jgi:hypothetical protein
MVTVAGLWPAIALGQGSVVISAEPESFVEIRTDPDIGVLAYHCLQNGLDPAHQTLDTETQYGKPIIISDDGSLWSMDTPANMFSALQLTMQHGQHFEHLDRDMMMDREEKGIPVSSIQDFPARSIQHLQYLSQYGQSLPYPGTLARSGDKLYWNGQPIQLVGFSSYETVGTPTTEIGPYLDVLASYHVNFTRMWCVDHNANNGCSFMPFRRVSGDGCWGSKFDITRPDDPAYLARLREYVTQAWRRGIVVQLCLFDRCSLNSTRADSWPHTPYNIANNVNNWFTLDGAEYPPAFTNTTGDVAQIHGALLRKIVAAIGDCGNVIYEIFNEPLDAFPNTPGFHHWVADVLVDAFAHPSREVFVNLGATDDESGLRRVVNSDGDTTPVTIGSREARQNADPSGDFYMYFGVDDYFAYQGSRPGLYVTIDCYDAGAGALELQYDATDGTLYKTGGSVTLSGTNTWKQHTYHVTDAYFGNRQNGGADFRIFGGTNNTFYVDIVRVSEQLPVPAPVTNPNPADQAANVGMTAVLSWSAADRATAYDVYFGASNPPTFRGRQTQTSYGPGPMAHDTTYFWRVDAVNDLGTTPGTVWSFTTGTFPGDSDHDGDVDQEDFGHFQRCLSGPNRRCGPGCDDVDFDLDGDVDQDDFGVFTRCLAGTAQPPDC